MANCQSCGTELSGGDHFCRNCGVPVATGVGDFIETQRFPSTDPGKPLYVTAPVAHPVTSGSAPLYQTASLGKKRFQRGIIWLVALLALAVVLVVGVGIGGDALRELRGRRAAQATMSRRSLEATIQNALGFRPGSVSDAEYPGLEGVFVNSLMSDDSPAALAAIQAGDVLTELSDQAVRNSNELAQALGSLPTGAPVAVKLYRDGETVASSIRIADPTFAPLQPKADPRDEGFLGISDTSRRRYIPGTQKWGVEIRQVIANGPADLAGLQSGDVITEFNGYAIRTPNEFGRRIRAAKPRSKVMVKFYRGATLQTVEMVIGHRG